MALPRFLYGDPSKTVDWVRKKRREIEARQPEAKARRAKEGLENLFKGCGMSKREAELALIQWGQWAARPQFWEDLRATAASRVYAVKSSGAQPNFRLDPQSQAMHKAFHQLRDDRVKSVLYLYYVVGLNFDRLSEPSRKQLRLGRSSFYAYLDRGTRMVYNRGMSIFEAAKKTLDK